MKVSFTTEHGHEYVLNHITERYSHSLKGRVLSEGPLWNKPQVQIDKRVRICTAPKGKGALLMIESGIVRTRRVEFV